ncbi:polysaccharide biosynthesis protein [Nocardioides marmorisolisilvae]|uniref:Polysaccharide biosynthesis protein n=2 Tax=Nocardioides marmorisolisilvae TaxID=1542737 RepID=A0A3N0DY05_9ACTN|nr:polysaccharide biosynthesis protein [Nocardioides marmorisolisilvae]
MNIAIYAFTILAAHDLGPDPFGALTALLNVTLVAAVLSLALQATAARRIAREPDDAALVEDIILKVGLRTALGLGAFFLALSPGVNAVLKLHSLPTAIMLAVAVVPLTVMGAQAGVLQGERRWVPLAALYVAAGVPRLIIGVALLAWRPDESVAFLAVTISVFAPVLVGWWALRDRPHGQPPTGDHTARALWSETVYNSQALLAFLALSSLDIVIARNTLEPKEAGLYAAGLILVKAVAFLPQFVVVLAFPDIGADEAPRAALLVSLLIISVIGLVATLGVKLLPDLALVFVGGDQYDAVSGRLWAFALLGTVISLVQLLVYSVLARPTRLSVAVLWAGLVALVAVGSSSSSVTGLIERVLVIDAVLLVVLLAVSLRRLGQQAPVTPAVGTD